MSTSLADAASTNRHVHVGKTTVDRPVDLFTRGTTNIFVHIYTKLQNHHLHNTSKTLDTHSALQTDTLLYVKKGKFMNSLENFYIYNDSKQENQINKKFISGTNKIFDVTVEYIYIYI